jgi:hypothetical protein
VPARKVGFVVSTVKDPVFVEAGRRGAHKRWSDPDNRRVVRIDSLSTEERALVLALISAKKAATSDHEVTAQEVSSASSTTPTS